MLPMNASSTTSGTQEIKHCCAQLYESDIAKLLLGESFHPGALKLTERLGSLLQLTAKSRVLDEANGTGASALLLARHFGWQVIGIDIGHQNLLRADGAGISQDLRARDQVQHSERE